MAEDVVKEYQSSLQDLTFNSKPLINMLTMLAEDHEKHAVHVVQVIESHIEKAHIGLKLPCLYLIDSIVKNLRESHYLELFNQNIVKIFSNVFLQVDEKTRQAMFKLRQTWNEIFPARKLYALDVRVNHIDPAWPIAQLNTRSVGGSIHVNPKFLVQSDSIVAAGVSSASAELPNIDDTIATSEVSGNEALMRHELIAKQRELLKIQQQKLELELEETKSKLLLQGKPEMTESTGLSMINRSRDPRTASREPTGRAPLSTSPTHSIAINETADTYLHSVLPHEPSQQHTMVPMVLYNQNITSTSPSLHGLPRPHINQNFTGKTPFTIYPYDSLIGNRQQSVLTADSVQAQHFLSPFNDPYNNTSSSSLTQSRYNPLDPRNSRPSHDSKVVNVTRAEQTPVVNQAGDVKIQDKDDKIPSRQRGSLKQPGSREKSDTQKNSVGKLTARASKRDSSTAVSSKRDSTTSAPNKHDSLTAVSSKRDSTTSAPNKHDSSTAVSSKRDSTTSAPNKHDSSTAVSSKRDSTTLISNKKLSTSNVRSSKDQSNASKSLIRDSPLSSDDSQSDKHLNNKSIVDESKKYSRRSSDKHVKDSSAKKSDLKQNKKRVDKVVHEPLNTENLKPRSNKNDNNKTPTSARKHVDSKSDNSTDDSATVGDFPAHITGSETDVSTSNVSSNSNSQCETLIESDVIATVEDMEVEVDDASNQSMTIKVTDCSMHNDPDVTKSDASSTITNSAVVTKTDRNLQKWRIPLKRERNQERIGPISDKKPRIGREQEPSADISDLFSKGDIDYRVHSGTNLKFDPSDQSAMNVGDRHPVRRDIDMRLDTDLRHLPYHSKRGDSMHVDKQDYDTRDLSGDSDLEIPKELSLKKQREILVEADRLANEGRINHDEHQTMLRQLDQVYSIQKQRRLSRAGEQRPKSLLEDPVPGGSPHTIRDRVPVKNRDLNFPDRRSSDHSALPTDVPRREWDEWKQHHFDRFQFRDTGKHIGSSPRQERLFRNDRQPSSNEMPQNSTFDARWQRNSGMFGFDFREEVVINNIPFNYCLTGPYRKIKLPSGCHYLTFDDINRVILLDDEPVYQIGEPVKEVDIDRRVCSFYYHGAQKVFWIDQEPFEVRVDAPPRMIKIAGKRVPMQLDGKDMMLLLDRVEKGRYGGSPRQIRIGENEHTLQFEPPSRTILIDQIMCEIILNRNIPAVAMEDGKLYGIQFDGDFVDVKIDDYDFQVPVDRSIKIRLGTRPHTLAVGGPAHEVILDGKWMEIKFGDSPRLIRIGNRDHHISLPGKPPGVKILSEVIDDNIVRHKHISPPLLPNIEPENVQTSSSQPVRCNFPLSDPAQVGSEISRPFHTNPPFTRSPSSGNLASPNQDFTSQSPHNQSQQIYRPQQIATHSQNVPQPTLASQPRPIRLQDVHQQPLVSQQYPIQPGQQFVAQNRPIRPQEIIRPNFMIQPQPQDAPQQFVSQPQPIRPEFVAQQQPSQPPEMSPQQLVNPQQIIQPQEMPRPQFVPQQSIRPHQINQQQYISQPHPIRPLDANQHNVIRAQTVPQPFMPQRPHLHAQDVNQHFVPQQQPIHSMYQISQPVLAPQPVIQSSLPVSNQVLLSQPQPVILSNLQQPGPLHSSIPDPVQYIQHSTSSGPSAQTGQTFLPHAIACQTITVSFNADQPQTAIATHTIPTSTMVSGSIPASSLLPTQPVVHHVPSVAQPSIDINALFAKLLNAGFIKEKLENQPKTESVAAEQPLQTPEQSLEADEDDDEDGVKFEEFPDLTEFNAGHLKTRYEGIIQRLYDGIQCSSCGTRFPVTDPERYREHLDWHFKSNKMNKEEDKKAQYRKWYYAVNDWIQFKELDDVDDGEGHMFEKMASEASLLPLKLNVPAGVTVTYCPQSSENETSDCCVICGDQFETYYDDERQNWHLRDAVQVAGKNYHHVCYEDANESMSSPPQLQSAPINIPVTPVNYVYSEPLFKHDDAIPAINDTSIIDDGSKNILTAIAEEPSHEPALSQQSGEVVVKRDVSSQQSAEVVVKQEPKSPKGHDECQISDHFSDKESADLSSDVGKQTGLTDKTPPRNTTNDSDEVPVIQNPIVDEHPLKQESLTPERPSTPLATTGSSPEKQELDIEDKSVKLTMGLQDIPSIRDTSGLQDTPDLRDPPCLQDASGDQTAKDVTEV